MAWKSRFLNERGRGPGLPPVYTDLAVTFGPELASLLWRTGFRSSAHVAEFSEEELLRLHGFGPRRVRRIMAELEDSPLPRVGNVRIARTLWERGGP